MKVGTDAMILGALIDVSSKKNALDIGTGTGVLSLMQAQKNQILQLTAIEIEENAFLEACLNVENSPFQKQIKVLKGDFLTFDFKEKFDLIFSNPPYFEKSYKSTDFEKNLARHNDSLPLDLFLEKVNKIIDEEGELWLILPIDNSKKIESIAIEMGFYIKNKILIFGKKNSVIRIVLTLTKIETKTIFSELTIRNFDGTYTEEYKKLTIDFHNRKL